MRKAIKTVVILGLSAATLSFGTACQSDAQTAAFVGGIGGALAGQALGHDTEATLIGAAAGTGIGYMIGNESDKNKQRQHQSSGW